MKSRLRKRNGPKGCWRASPFPALPRRSTKDRGEGRRRGFDWENIDQVFDKMREELAELAAARADGAQRRSKTKSATSSSVLVQRGALRKKLIPEQALRKTNAKFRRRFTHVESRAGRAGQAAGSRQHRRYGNSLAGSQAQRTMTSIRPFAGRHEYADAVSLSARHLGWTDLDILPVRFFVVASGIGGQLLGAFDDGFLCGLLSGDSRR